MSKLQEWTNKVICGDCLELMKELPDGCVDLVVTDPPYGIKRDSSWLTTLNVKRGKPANVSDDKIHGDDGPFDATPLFRFWPRIIFGFPYIQDPAAKGWLVWDKQPGVDHNTLGNPIEMASSTCWRGFRLKRCMWSGYYRDNNEPRWPHPTQKPLRLIKELIAENSKQGDLVFDPYMGSGTTAVACKQLGRRFIGFEINPEYVKICNERLKQEELFNP